MNQTIQFLRYKVLCTLRGVVRCPVVSARIRVRRGERNCLAFSLLFSGHPVLIGPLRMQSRKARGRFFMSVCLSVRIYKLGCHWTEFREMWYWGLTLKLAEKTQIFLKIWKKVRCFTWKRKYVCIVDICNNTSGTHYCVSVTTLAGCLVLLTATSVSQQYRRNTLLCFCGDCVNAIVPLSRYTYIDCHVFLVG